MSRSRLLVAVLALASTGLVAPAGAAKVKGPEVLPLPNGWQPEGIAAGDDGRSLFVGSIPTGQVLRLDPRTGRTTIVVGPREGRAAIGLKVDRGLLFVAGGPTGRAFVYDARTGADVRDVALTTGLTFVNDVTLTRRAAYFTDSRQPQLYRLDRGRRGIPAASATRVPITGDLQYDADPATNEANGIVVTKDGSALVVGQSRTGGLFRVDPATGASQSIALSGGATSLPNADGLLLEGRTLYVVQNRLNRIAVVRLSRDLRSGVVEGFLADPDFDVPTTVASVRGGLYAVNARFGTPATPETEYDVVRVTTAKRAGKGRGRGGHGGRGR